MFESVKRVTDTTDADWIITHESAEQRWKDRRAALQHRAVFTKMLYSRMFFGNGGVTTSLPGDSITNCSV
jgi:hypothetical protein